MSTVSPVEADTCRLLLLLLLLLYLLHVGRNPAPREVPSQVGSVFVTGQMGDLGHEHRLAGHCFWRTCGPELQVVERLYVVVVVVVVVEGSAALVDVFLVHAWPVDMAAE